MKKVAKIFLLSLLLTVGLLGLQQSISNAGKNYPLEWQYIDKILTKKIAGDWYNSAGSLSLSVHDRYINECAVVGAYNAAGGDPGTCYFTLREAEGLRDIKIDWDSGYEPENRHMPFVRVNDGEKLYRQE